MKYSVKITVDVEDPASVLEWARATYHGAKSDADLPPEDVGVMYTADDITLEHALCDLIGVWPDFPGECNIDSKEYLGQVKIRAQSVRKISKGSGK